MAAAPACCWRQLTNIPTHDAATIAGSDGTTPKAQAQADVSSPSGTGRVSWPKFLGSLFASGAIAGTVIDGIHSKEMLQVGARRNGMCKKQLLRGEGGNQSCVFAGTVTNGAHGVRSMGTSHCERAQQKGQGRGVLCTAATGLLLSTTVNSCGLRPHLLRTLCWCRQHNIHATSCISLMSSTLHSPHFGALSTRLQLFTHA